jgi:DNA processing protein
MDLKWWLALGRVPGVGPATFVKLVQSLGSPEAVFRAPQRSLLAMDRVGPKVAHAIAAYRDDGWPDREVARMEAMGVRMVTFGSEEYPPALGAIPDPPPYLFVRGRLCPEDRIALAIVGSRAASQYGLKATFRMAREVASRGITVVSGMARGIDSEAHRGALAAGGRTVAVLGSGLNVIYPPENRELFVRIAEHGAVVTEYPLDTQPEAVHFPARNRIISGMCLGTTIVEAAPKSGSLITAGLALEQGREVFAVPGSVDSMRSRGTHQLIRDGAHLVESAGDILEILGSSLRAWGLAPPAGQPTPAPHEPLSAQEEATLACLGDEPVHIDTLMRQGGMGASEASCALLQLELKGRVKQLPGKWFLRIFKEDRGRA